MPVDESTPERFVSNRLRTLVFYVIGLLFACAAFAFMSISKEWAEVAHPWNMGDWLISYEGGFVRRGLMGSVILWASDIVNMSPLRIISGLQILLFSALLVQVMFLIRGKSLNFAYLMMLASPAAILFPILDPQGGGRKELLLFVILASWILKLRKNRNPSWLSIGAFSLLLALMVLVHEIFIFASPAFALALYAANARELNQSILIKGVGLLTPLFLVAFAAFLFGKTDQAAQIAMCQALADRIVPTSVCQGAIAFPLDSKAAVENTFAQVAGYQYMRFYPVYLVAAMLPIALMASGRLRDITSIATAAANPLTIAAIMGLSLLPLFIIGLDWGRWIYIYVMICLLMFAPLLSDRDESDITRRELWLAGPAAVCLIAYASIWAMPHCCNIGYGVSIAARVTAALSS